MARLGQEIGVAKRRNRADAAGADQPILIDKATAIGAFRVQHLARQYALYLLIEFADERWRTQSSPLLLQRPIRRFGKLGYCHGKIRPLNSPYRRCESSAKRLRPAYLPAPAWAPPTAPRSATPPAPATGAK